MSWCRFKGWCGRPISDPTTGSAPIASAKPRSSTGDAARWRVPTRWAGSAGSSIPLHSRTEGRDMTPTIARRLFPALATCLLAALLSAAPAPAQAERIKDLAQVAGVRGNPLVGYGLVVGLDGSGDRTSQTPFTVQSLKTMLDQLGVTIPPGV